MDEAKDTKEREGFLDKTKHVESEKAIKDEDDEEERNFKTYLRIILPHVGLVLASVSYAVAGAFIFYSVEMRHERETKSHSIRKVTAARFNLVDNMWNSSHAYRMAKETWLRDAERDFANWTSILYTAFKREFVKFQHVSTTRTFRPLPDGHGYNLTFEHDDYNVWTPSSSIFFAWTTMATIGYGNIVPVTMEGRIICVFFALFGTPLAILTIGDLGKFLSESTIAGYKKYKQWRDALRTRFGRTPAIEQAAQHKRSFDSELSSIEDLLLHKAQVPVIVVFAILLIYIAFGGLLFSVLEGWKYVDAFYFCFISLTTVGFGDMVPRRHAYLVLMLLYIGVGLAVTTMCIDLVGIHYLQKIHYFGRKFKGYDLLRLLRQRRMIERRMAMAAQAADIMQMYFDAVERGSIPPSPTIAKYFLEQELPIHEPISGSPDWPIDNVYDNMYERQQQQNTAPSWSPSGPDISIECSIPTTPSLYEREQMFSTMRERSWQRSPDSFYTFPPPSPDYNKIAQEARSAKRSGSCPGRYILRAVSPQTPTPLGMSLMEDWESYRELLEQSKRPRLSIPNINVDSHGDDSDEEVYPPSLLSPLEVDFGTPSSSTTYSQPSSPSGDSAVEFAVRVGARFRDTGRYPDSGRDSLATGSDADENVMMFHQNLPIYAVEHHTVGSEHALQASFNCPTEFISHAPPTMVTDNYCFVVDGNAVNVDNLTMDSEWWKPTSRPTHYYYSEDLKTFRRVHIVIVKGRIVGARMRGILRKAPAPTPPPPPPRTPTTPGGTLVPTVPPPPPPPAPPPIVHKNVPLKHVFRVSRYYSYWKTCAHFHRIITVITPVKEQANAAFQKRIFFQFLWHRDAKEADKLRVAMEYTPLRQAQLLQPRGTSFSVGGPSPVSPQSGSGGSNPPSGSNSPRGSTQQGPEGGDEAGPSSSGTQQPDRRSSGSSVVPKRRRTSSIFQL